MSAAPVLVHLFIAQPRCFMFAQDDTQMPFTKGDLLTLLDKEV